MRNKIMLETLPLLLLAVSLVAPAAKFAHASPQSASNADVDLTNPDVAAIVQIAKEFSEAFDAADAKRISEFYSPDVIYMAQGRPTELGNAAAAQRRQVFFSTYQASIDVHVDEVKIFADMGFDRATFTMTMKPKAGGEAMTSKGRVMEIVRKEGEKWKSLRVMVNTEE